MGRALLPWKRRGDGHAVGAHAGRAHPWPGPGTLPSSDELASGPVPVGCAPTPSDAAALCLAQGAGQIGALGRQLGSRIASI